MSRTKLIGLVASTPLVVALALGLAGCNDSTSTMRPDIEAADEAAAADYDYLIPAGTGARLDAGERVEIIPGELEVKVGEVIRIVNEDERGHVIGAFYVAAGETLRQTFSSPGVLAGECSVHPSGSFVLTVVA
jgi:plastocyanin